MLIVLIVGRYTVEVRERVSCPHMIIFLTSYVFSGSTTHSFVSLAPPFDYEKGLYVNNSSFNIHQKSQRSFLVSSSTIILILLSFSLSLSLLLLYYHWRVLILKRYSSQSVTLLVAKNRLFVSECEFFVRGGSSFFLSFSNDLF